MVPLNTFLPLRNPVKTYDWGHASWISQLLGLDCPAGQRQAEVWMGAHPGSPSEVVLDEAAGTGGVALDALIGRFPREMLGESRRGGARAGLPFLFKVLAADRPLSIQCHPSLDAARQGCAREDAAGLDRADPARNYRDDNHKPEILCAISEFWGLCGFRPAQAIREDLQSLAARTPAGETAAFLRGLDRILENGGTDPGAALRDLTREILQSGEWNQAVAAELARMAAAGREDRFRFLAEAAILHPADRGLLFFLVLQLHRLSPGQALYIPSGVLHAYLYGLGVELMANSDNVLRGGLTAKHVDVPELLANLDPLAAGLRIVPAAHRAAAEYLTPCREFALSRYGADNGAVRAELPAAQAPRIVLGISGTSRWHSANGQTRVLGKGQSMFIRPDGSGLSVEFEGEFFVATVGAAEIPERLVAGVDGGGTSTRVCLMDACGQVLGLGRSGPSSIDTVPAEVSRASLRTAMAAAFADFAARPAAGLGRLGWTEERRRDLLRRERPVEGVVAGIGGVVSAADETLVAGMLAELPQVGESAACLACNDMKTALAGGNVLEPGIVCILGTGSVAYGRNAAGREHRCGGWGWKEGDPGSSFDLGISAIRMMVRAGDGRLPETPFTRAVMERLGLAEAADITTCLYQNDLGRTAIAGLAPLVTAWAERGDGHARTIALRAIGETVEMIACVKDRLFPGTAAVPLAIIGSLGNAGGWYRDRLLDGLGAIRGLYLRTDGWEPVVGAAQWALRLAARQGAAGSGQG